MKHKKHVIITPARFKGLIIIFVWMILFCGTKFFHDSNAIIGLRTASASVQYGIQGQQAPELNLTTWVDGDGTPIDPIKLNNYRGKVIYLYFFQDW